MDLITEDQARNINALINDHDLNMEAFKAWLVKAVGVEHIPEIPATDHKKVIRKVNLTIKAREGE